MNTIEKLAMRIVAEAKQALPGKKRGRRTRHNREHLGSPGPGPRRVASDRTRSFTPEQRSEVDTVVGALVRQSVDRINAESPRIKEMDRRPRQGWTEERPEVHFPYVAQAMLEDLIHDLEKLV